MLIEKGVPLPYAIPASAGPSRKRRYPFHDMAVGDSVLMDGADIERSLAALRQHKKRHDGWDYCTKRFGTAVRVWRVS